jgi:DNA-binding protein H-NS
VVIELITGNAVAKRSKKRTYKNPNDQSLTWNGTGKKPDWVEKLHAEGYSLADNEPSH